MGVMLFNEESGHFNFILTRPLRRISALFPGTSERIVVARTVRFYNLLMSTHFESIEDLTLFCTSRKGSLKCTSPSPIVVEAERFSVMLQELLHALVF